MTKEFAKRVQAEDIIEPNRRMPLLINRNFEELNPLIVGEERCESFHSFGPAVREYTLIHYCIRGQGSIMVNGEVHPVRAGQAFIIHPEEITTYTADGEDPWCYRWIGFNGRLSEKFSELPRVFSPSPKIFETIGNAIENDDMREYRLAAALFELYADMFSGASSNRHYVRRVRDYINASYMNKISVERIAEEMSLDRRYLSRIFKEKTGSTIQDYIVSVRLSAACEYLKRGATVLEAAQLSGYEDECNFSKMFKRRFGMSPGAWGRQRRMMSANT